MIRTGPSIIQLAGLGDRAPKSWRVPYWDVQRLREGAKIPVKQDPDDVGWDLFYCPEEGRAFPETICLEGLYMMKLPTGLAMAFHPDWAFVFYGKSGKGIKFMWWPGAGVIDAGYRGELVVLMQCPGRMHTPILPAEEAHAGLKWGSPEPRPLNPPAPGEKICQGLFLPNPEAIPTPVKDLPGSARGEGGFGSQGG